MQVMLVDAVKVHKLKQRAAKCLIQNCRDTHLAGQTIKEILTYLDLWEGGAHEAISNYCDPADGNSMQS